MSEKVGIVGLGDLGSRMTLQAEAAGFEVVAFEPFEAKVPEEAIDPNIKIAGLMWPPRTVGSIGEVTSRAEIIHWCAPLGALAAADYVPEDCLVILHDSVMTSSYHAGYELFAKKTTLGRVGLVHALMNQDSNVFVATTAGDTDRTENHMRALRLHAERISVDDHDILMAHSQARLAWGVLFDLPVLKCTPARQLTPSGMEYLEALKQRDASWTTSTLRSIFMNPYIPESERAQALAKIDELESK